MSTLTTFDSTDNPEAAQSQQESEAKSLATGERIIQEQEQAEQEVYDQARKDVESQLNYAGKFRTAEDLEKAYLELQSKFSSGERQEEEDEQGQGPEASEEEVEEQEEEEEYEEDDEDDAPPLTEAEGQEILDNAGGKEVYDNALKWASEAIPLQEQEMFNAILESNNKDLINFAVQGLVYRFKAQGDYQGQLITGKPVSNTGVQPFRSQAELAKAINHPDYRNDPAYRLDVERRLAVSSDDLL